MNPDQLPDEPNVQPDDSTLSEDELALLYRLDERTEHIEESVDRAVSKTEDNADDIEQVRKKVKRNTTVLGGITGGISLIVTIVGEKIAKLA